MRTAHRHVDPVRRWLAIWVSRITFYISFYVLVFQLFRGGKKKSRSELLNNLATLILLRFQEDEFSTRPNYEND